MSNAAIGTAVDAGPHCGSSVVAVAAATAPNGDDDDDAPAVIDAAELPSIRRGSAAPTAAAAAVDASRRLPLPHPCAGHGELQRATVGASDVAAPGTARRAATAAAGAATSRIGSSATSARPSSRTSRRAAPPRFPLRTRAAAARGARRRRQRAKEGLEEPLSYDQMEAAATLDQLLRAAARRGEGHAARGPTAHRPAFSMRRSLSGVLGRRHAATLAAAAGVGGGVHRWPRAEAAGRRGGEAHAQPAVGARALRGVGGNAGDNRRRAEAYVEANGLSRTPRPPPPPPPRDAGGCRPPPRASPSAPLRRRARRLAARRRRLAARLAARPQLAHKPAASPRASPERRRRARRCPRQWHARCALSRRPQAQDEIPADELHRALLADAAVPAAPAVDGRRDRRRTTAREGGSDAQLVNSVKAPYHHT